MGSAPPSLASSTDNPVDEDSFEALTFTSDNLGRYIRKLKEEIANLKAELAMEKKRKEVFEREVKVRELYREKMELETKLQQIPQSGTMKDAERGLEKSGEMEHKFGEMKEQLKKELKEEMQQLTSAFEESKEKLASVSKKMEQIANEIKPMKSKLSEVHDEIFLPDAMTEGGIEYFCRKTPFRFVPEGTVEITAPGGGNWFYVKREFLQTYENFASLMRYHELDPKSYTTNITFNTEPATHDEWSSLWKTMAIEKIFCSMKKQEKALSSATSNATIPGGFSSRDSSQFPRASNCRRKGSRVAL